MKVKHIIRLDKKFEVALSDCQDIFDDSIDIKQPLEYIVNRLLINYKIYLDEDNCIRIR